MAAAATQLVQKLIRDNFVMVFSKSYCPYCNKAKALLDSLKQPYYAIELDRVENGAAIQQELKQRTGQSTVPNIFIGEKHVGGCDDLHALHAQGKLVPMLQQGPKK